MAQKLPHPEDRIFTLDKTQQFDVGQNGENMPFFAKFRYTVS